MDVSFAIAFDARQTAEAAAASLRSESYEVELQPQTDGSIVVVAGTALSESELDSAVKRMRSVASRWRGDFLGHGGLASFPEGRRAHSVARINRPERGRAEPTAGAGRGWTSWLRAPVLSVE